MAALNPCQERGAVLDALARTTEGVALLASAGRQPYHDLPDLGEILPAARVHGFHLEAAALLDVASFIVGGVEIARRVASVESAPRLAHLASQVRDASDVAAVIRRAVLPSGEVADDASPKLLEVRRALTRLRVQLQSVMESLLRGKEADRILQDKVVTTRNDRYVLLLKAEHRGQLPGVVHGSSSSGASVFLEPMPAVELNNDIVTLGGEERAEVVRILRELTARVADRAPDLAEAASILGELDAVQAMALLARDMDAAPPEMVDDLDLDLVNARHPLLMGALAGRLGIPQRATRDLVPVSLRAGSGSPVLVISGPNTGGKTVALKTVGLLALMAQSGLHIPADRGSRLPVFRRIYADIGDDQSIAESLSTFSAHLASIVEMTRDLVSPALILLDEAGAGTDPTEGGGLGVAIVDHFRSRGAMVVATTHHGLMKAYAQSTPGVACASFGYDPATYAPTYRLSHGVPGRSLALEMAERLGLPAEVVADARSRLSAKEAQTEALLKRLEDERAVLQNETRRLREEQEAVAATAEAQRAAGRALEARTRSEAETFARELRKRGEEAARQAATAIREAVQRVETTRRAAASEGSRVRTEVIRRIREAQDEALRGVAPELATEPEVADADLRVGSRVRVRSLGVIGEVTALPTPGDAELAVGGKRMRVPRGELVALGGPAPASVPANLSPRRRVESQRDPVVERAPVGQANLMRAAGPGAWQGKSEGGVAEINVVGLRVDEAIPRVDKFLDDATLAERRQVRVIHGFGQGTLRKAVAGLLEGHPHVAAFRPGGSREGGGGATVVELKE